MVRVTGTILGVFLLASMITPSRIVRHHAFNGPSALCSDDENGSMRWSLRNRREDVRYRPPNISRILDISIHLTDYRGTDKAAVGRYLKY